MAEEKKDGFVEEQKPKMDKIEKRRVELLAEGHSEIFADEEAFREVEEEDGG